MPHIVMTGRDTSGQQSMDNEHGSDGCTWEVYIDAAPVQQAMTVCLGDLEAGLMRLAHRLHLLHSIWVLKGADLVVIEVYVWQRHLPSMIT